MFFDIVLKTGIMSISPGCPYESTEELVQHIHASNSLTPARSEQGWRQGLELFLKSFLHYSKGISMEKHRLTRGGLPRCGDHRGGCHYAKKRLHFGEFLDQCTINILEMQPPCRRGTVAGQCLLTCHYLWTHLRRGNAMISDQHSYQIELTLEQHRYNYVSPLICGFFNKHIQCYKCISSLLIFS